MEATFELEQKERKLKRITQEKQALSAVLARAEKRIEQLTTRRMETAMDTPIVAGKALPRTPPAGETPSAPAQPQFTLG